MVKTRKARRRLTTLGVIDIKLDDILEKLAALEAIARALLKALKATTTPTP